MLTLDRRGRRRGIGPLAVQTPVPQAASAALGDSEALEVRGAGRLPQSRRAPAHAAPGGAGRPPVTGAGVPGARLRPLSALSGIRRRRVSVPCRPLTAQGGSVLGQPGIGSRPPCNRKIARNYASLGRCRGAVRECAHVKLPMRVRQPEPGWRGGQRPRLSRTARLLPCCNTLTSAARLRSQAESQRPRCHYSAPRPRRGWPARPGREQPRLSRTARLRHPHLSHLGGHAPLTAASVSHVRVATSSSHSRATCASGSLPRPTDVEGAGLSRELQSLTTFDVLPKTRQMAVHLQVREIEISNNG